jgi:amino acid adenylation domain-containing protein
MSYEVEARFSESAALHPTASEQIGRERKPKEEEKDKCIHELFRQQAKLTPETVAVVCEGRALSYRELEHRSNQLAHALRKLGIGSETLVAICLERSPELIVGLLGILKAGGAYVPMDPGYPPERLAFILEDSQARVLVTNRELHCRWPNLNTGTIHLDPDWQEIADQSVGTPANVVSSTNLAYVIYTSGSTGKPKGVLIEHLGMVNLVGQYRELYGIQEGFRISQMASASFDASGAEIWPTLLCGATLYIAPDELRADPELLQRWLIANRITIAYATTVIAERLLTLPWPERRLALRFLLLGGERFRGKPRDRHYPFRIYNEYGPTEDTVWTTVAEVVDGDRSELTIGRPLANHQVYVLDGNQRPVPPGEPGELCIGGVGLARGYLNRPKLTAEKFIRNPFGSTTMDRLYRTGDLVRYLPEGDLEFLGRIDNQVKIRGYRVEPGEIEVVLARHSRVRESVVVARENPQGDRRLVAYVVPGTGLTTRPDASSTGQEPKAAGQPLHQKFDLELANELRSYLAAKVPSYMIPSAFVFLDRLPLTPNGKLDRRGLPEPSLSGNQFVEPQTELERKLAEIWRNVLAVERVGREDNFFELGGDSLLAGRFVMEVERVFRKRLPIATLVQTPTIEKLSITLQARDGKLASSPVVAIQTQGSRPPFFAVHGLRGEVIFYGRLAQHLGKDQPIYGIHGEGLRRKFTRHRSIEAIARYYIGEIGRIQAHGPYYLGGYCIGGVIAFEMAQQLNAAGEKVACLVLIDPDQAEPSPRRSPLEKRIRLALDEAASLSLNKKLRYLIHRVARRAKWELGQLRTAASDLIEPFYHGPNPYAGPVLLDPKESPLGRMLLRAQSKYVPRAYPGRIVLFRAPAADDNPLEADRGWGRVAAEGVEIHDIPGDHLTVFEPQHLPIVAAKLDACIRSALDSQKESS